MKPVFQRCVDFGHGDCFSACLASILELDLDSVPNFRSDSMHDGRLMIEHILEWLHPRGVSYFELDLWKGQANWSFLETYCILTIPSQIYLEGKHAVVGLWERQGDTTLLKIVHDPNPNNEPNDVNLVGRCGFIIKRGIL